MKEQLHNWVKKRVGFFCHSSLLQAAFVICLRNIDEIWGKKVILKAHFEVALYVQH